MPHQRPLSLYLTLAVMACHGPLPGPFIYVANFDANSVTAYLTVAQANDPPLRTFQGNGTDLLGPTNVAVDSSHTLYVANAGDTKFGPSITVYPLSNGGDVQPSAIIQGPLTQLASPRAVALDPSGNIWVANFATNAVTEFAPTGNSNRAPIRTVTAGVSGPIGLGFYNGALIVLNGGNLSVTTYANEGASGQPQYTMSGSNTRLKAPQGLAVDIGGNLWITEYDADAVLFFPGGNQANGNATPWCEITGSVTGLSGPKGIAVDRSGVVYVANGRNTSIVSFQSDSFISRGGATGPSFNIAPIHAVKGSSTQLSHIIGLTTG